MKNLLIATIVTGAAIAGLLLYLRSETTQYKSGNEIKDAADDAYGMSNQFIGKEEKAFDPALN